MISNIYQRLQPQNMIQNVNVELSLTPIANSFIEMSSE